MDNSLKITILGGQEEIGLNSTAIETEDDIVIIDLGNNFEDEEFGVDFYIPNLDLIKNKVDKVRGILITHGHYDHRAAIPYLIDQLEYPPIYGSPFTIALIKQQLKNKSKDKRMRLIPLQPRQEINLGRINVKPIHLTHSIIGNYGYFLKTPAGNVFHTSDFKFDETPFREEVSDYDSLIKAGNEGVLAALIDSTRANQEGHSQSETSIAQNLEKLIKGAPGRIIVSTFAQMISRINQIALIGKKYQKEIFIKGSTLEKTTKIAKEMDLLDKSLKLRDAEEMPHFADEKILLFVTGSQGEEKAVLNRMTEIKKGPLKIKPTDTIILSSSTIPSNIITIQRMIDNLADTGSRVFTDDVIDIHAGGHGHRQEIKQMIEYLKPQFIVPIEGYVSFRQQLARLASGLGYRQNQIILTKNNQPIILGSEGYKKSGSQKRQPNVVIGERLIKNGAEIIDQRKKIAKKGLMIFWINQRKKEVEISSIGVPQSVLKEANNNLKSKRLLYQDPKEMKKAMERILSFRFEDELIPEIMIKFI